MGRPGGSEPPISGSLMQFPAFQILDFKGKSHQYFFGTQSLHKAFTESQTVSGAAEQVAFTEDQRLSHSENIKAQALLQDYGSGSVFTTLCFHCTG